MKFVLFGAATLLLIVAADVFMDKPSRTRLDLLLASLIFAAVLLAGALAVLIPDQK